MQLRVDLGSYRSRTGLQAEGGDVTRGRSEVGYKPVCVLLKLMEHLLKSC